MRSLFVLVVALFGATPLLAQTPEWIWFRKTDTAETRYFRKTFSLDAQPSKAELVATADDSLEVFVNGRRALSANEWASPRSADIKNRLKAGRNVIAIRAVNGDSSPAGALAQITITSPAGKLTVVTDESWKAEDREVQDWNQVAFDDAAWSNAKSLGKHGVEPWGDVLTARKPVSQPVRQATPADALYVLKDFKVELLQSGGAEDGSWVNLCKDNKGRLIISPQYASANSEGGLLRITLGTDGKVAKREFIARPLYDAQGMVFANNALWVVVNKYSTKFDWLVSNHRRRKRHVQPDRAYQKASRRRRARSSCG